MMDVVRKNGDRINIEELSKGLGCKVVEISALKGTGIAQAAEAAVWAARTRTITGTTVATHRFSGTVEHSIAHIEEAVLNGMGIPEERQRWYAVKIFERDEKVLKELKISDDKIKQIERDIKSAEEELDDDAESIITNERYIYIAQLMKVCCKKKRAGKLTISDKIDKIVTNRFLALPIFAAVMILVYYISVSTVGTWATDWTNDGLFGDGWHLFGIGSEQYEQEITDYAVKNIWTEELKQIVSSAASEGVTGSGEILGAMSDEDFGGFEEAYGMYSEALTEAGYNITEIVDTAMVNAPDTSEYGIWLPGIPVLIGNILEAVNCSEWQTENSYSAPIWNSNKACLVL